MLGFDGTMVVCPATEQCLEWVQVYLKDCVCDLRSATSLGLGLVSVCAWGVAEVPQIITTFKEKSTEGLSLAFLMTWVVGDVFNLVGCFLEEATLPTQLYTAALYTVATLILTYQVVYYDYLYSYLHPELKPAHDADAPRKHREVDAQPSSKPQMIGGGTTPSIPDGASRTSSISVPQGRRTPRGDLFYASARSLTSSYTPPIGSYVLGSRESGSQTQGLLRDSSQSGPGADPSSGSPRSRPGSLAATVAGTFALVGTVGLSANHLSARGSVGSTARVLHAGRRFLQSRRGLRESTALAFPGPSFLGEERSAEVEGEVLGWIMALIYMGGRLPQIWHNIKRGSVEGLSPFMFVFALVGNATYVGSILVRNTDWDTVKHNMPWLVDAGVCVVLDFFIILQFVYFRVGSKKAKAGSLEDIDEEKKGHYEAVV